MRVEGRLAGEECPLSSVSEDSRREEAVGRIPEGALREHSASVTHRDIPMRTSEHPQYGQACADQSLRV